MTAVSSIFTISAHSTGEWVTPPHRSRELLVYPLTLEPEGVVEPRVPEGFVWQAAREVLPDFLSCLDAARLVSDRVREVVEPFDTGEVMWLPAHVRAGDGSMLRYWLVHYPRLRDVFDPQATTYGPGGPLRWVVDIARVQNTPVFMVPGTSLETFLVHPVVKDALVAAGVTGMHVRRTRT
jgi:hypothetical protein